MARVIEGVNDLFTTNPELKQEWDAEKNDSEGYDPRKLSSGSTKKVYWKCKKYNHSYSVSINSKTSNQSGCPYCSGKIVLKGFNDLATNNPTIANEWHPTMNTDLLPQNVTPKSGKKVWWLCKNGHSFQARVSDRTNGHGCPYCSGRKPIKGINDLATVFPEIAAEWCYEKNDNHFPEDFCHSSKAKVWWICKYGHIWNATIKNRVHGHGCPYCAGSKPITGENDLLTRYPAISKEWHKEKNQGVSPEEVSCYSNKKVWWFGQCGHEWQDTPGHRVMGRGCPICKKQYKTSFPEQAILYYIRKQYPDSINGYRDIFGNAMELDVFIPSLQFGIEYDGKAWHNSDSAYERERKKYLICKENSINLIRIKESKYNSSVKICDYLLYCDKDLDNTIKQLSKIIPFNVEINTEKDRVKIQETYRANFTKESFFALFPKESQEWHPTKNGKLNPRMFSCGSSEKIWWICKKGHEWQAAIRDRANGDGCPYCSNHRVLYGFNDLLTVNTALANEWHNTKNLPLTPREVLSTSIKTVWWKCDKGHEWQAKIRDRARGNRCPYCSNKRVLKGYNDLATIDPSLVLEWDYEKNVDISPDNITAGSSKKAWWKCKKCKYSWKATISNRHRGVGCPNCAKEKRTTVLNTLNSTRTNNK